jgi:hypothetical protein
VSREDIVAVASRLFSIFLLITIARQVPSAIALLSQDVGADFIALVAIVLLAGVFVCGILWFFPLTVARKLLPVMKEQNSATSMDASVGLSVGLTLIGVWVLANGLIDATYWTTLFLRTRQLDTTYFEWSHEHIANMVATVVELVLSAWLIFGASGIRRLIYRYRYGGPPGAA